MRSPGGGQTGGIFWNFPVLPTIINQLPETKIGNGDSGCLSHLNDAPSRIEPWLPDRVGLELLNLVTKLAAEAASLGERLHPRTAAGLADAVRLMNC